MSIKKIILIPLFIIGALFSALADGTKDDVEVAYKYRFGVDFQIKLAKGLKLDLEPEFRFYDGLDKIMLNGGLTYKTFGCIYWGATYRLEANRVENTDSSTTSYNAFGGGTNEYKLEANHRFAFDVTYKDSFGRFTPSFRLRYNNFTDDDVTDREFMRYRAKVDYNIRKCKITPHVAVEAFQELDENMLYKMRYSTGFDLKTGKNSALGFDYKFDFFTLEYKNANIFSVGYKFKF